jgi:hypothetical protein
MVDPIGSFLFHTTDDNAPRGMCLMQSSCFLGSVKPKGLADKPEFESAARTVAAAGSASGTAAVSRIVSIFVIDLNTETLIEGRNIVYLK